MEFYVLTIFPDMFDAILNQTIIKRAKNKGLINVNVVNLRKFTEDKHRTTDDYIYGGGAGMVMKIEPIYRALNAIEKTTKIYKILLSPRGEPFNQNKAAYLLKKEAIAMVCGRYEGVDERIKHFINEEISIGNFVLSGGEIAAMAIIDATTRLIPGVLGNKNSLVEETFNGNFIEYPQYTRPREFMGLRVPDILLSGNHKAIHEWRKHESKGNNKKDGESIKWTN